MLLEPPPPTDRRAVTIAIVTAAAPTFATALATWAVDELRAKYGTKRPSDVGIVATQPERTS